MQRYLIVRFFQGIVALFILSIVIFALARIAGDPALLMLPEGATEEEYRIIRAHLGLDKPFHVQYIIFITKAAKGDLGNSNYTGRPVIDSIKARLPNSFKLLAVALLMTIAWAIPLGAMAAAKEDTPVDIFARLIAGLGQSMPVFWVGLILIQLFSVEFRLLPTYGMSTWKSYIMPAFSISLFWTAGIIRLLRSSMLEALDSEYIKLARIKGVSERVIVWKHALRNSLLPVASFGGMYVAMGVTSAIVVETVFSWPGMGSLAYKGIANRDYPVIQAVVLLAAVIVITANLVTDIIYAWLDPRIRYSST